MRMGEDIGEGIAMVDGCGCCMAWALRLAWVLITYQHGMCIVLKGRVCESSHVHDMGMCTGQKSS